MSTTLPIMPNGDQMIPFKKYKAISLVKLPGDEGCNVEIGDEVQVEFFMWSIYLSAFGAVYQTDAKENVHFKFI